MRTTALGCALLLVTLPAGAEDGPPELDEIRLRLPEGRAVLATEVLRVDDGTVLVRIAQRGGREPFRPAEGIYLALGVRQLEREFEDATLLRLRVQEVLGDGRLRLRVAKNAVSSLEQVKVLALFRPEGATTALLRALPAAVPIVDESEHIEGMSLEEVQHLQESKRNLKEIGIALLNFHDTHKHFPPGVLMGPDGEPWHSWRVLILPYLDHLDLYDRYRLDEPWDGPNNRKLISEMPNVYHDSIHGDQPEEGYTSYAAVVGPNAAFVTANYNGRELDLWKAIAQGAAFGSFVDGLSNTLAVGSVSLQQEIPWTKPEDIELDLTTPTIGQEDAFAAPYEGQAGKAGVFLRCDGSVLTIRSDVEPSLFRNLLQRNDRQVVSEPPSLDPDYFGRGEDVVRVISFRRTDHGPEAVLKYEIVPRERSNRAGAGSAPVETEDSDASSPPPEQEQESDRHGENPADQPG